MCKIPYPLNDKLRRKRSHNVTLCPCRNIVQIKYNIDEPNFILEVNLLQECKNLKFGLDFKPKGLTKEFPLAHFNSYHNH